MIWLYIYIGLGVLTSLLLFFTAASARDEFKRRYPYITIPKNSFIANVGSVFKVLLLCFFPIVNIALVLTLLFNAESIIEKTIYNIYEKYGGDSDD